MENSGGDRMFRMQDGYAALVKWLEREAVRAGAKIHLNSRVQAISWKPNEVTARSVRNGADETFEARAALITLPIGVFKNRTPCAIEFSPEIDTKLQAIKAMEMGAVVKLVLHFREPWWPVQNFGFIHAKDQPFQTWWADERAPILIAWCGGPSTGMLPKDSEGLTRIALEALHQIFQVPRSRLQDTLVKTHFHDWTHNPFSGGAYSYVPVGGMHLPKAIAQPIEQTLFFAGEATVFDGQQGTVHGAIRSGHRAAKEILAA
jgi:monoamine oxidase